MGALDGLTVLDLGGEKVALRDVVGDRPTVLVFLRHFGCLLCREQAAHAETLAPALAQLGARVALVGNGNVGFARAFREELGGTLPLYVSPDRSAYAALGFVDGVETTFAPRSFLHAARALLAGHRQGPVQGAPWQQGGVALVLPDGSLPWIYRSQEAGDHPADAAVLAAVRAGAQPAA